MAEANAVRPQSSKSAAFSIPDMVIDRHPFAALHESAYGTKRTSESTRLMAAFGGKADISEH
jgi:hypothetical protein